MAFLCVMRSTEFLKLAGVDHEFGGFTPENDKQSLYFFPPKSFMLNGAKLFELLVYIGFYYDYKISSGYYVHSLIRIIAYQSVVMAALVATSMISLILALIFVSHNALFLQLSLYSDIISKYFSIMMLYPLIFNQLLSRLYHSYWMRAFTHRRIIYHIVTCMTLSSIAAIVLIKTSGMRRYFLKSLGFFDSGVPGHHMNINRLFYIFPIGCLFCYLVLYIHIRYKVDETPLNRITNNGKQRVFVQLIVTILCYVVMCIFFEFLNYQDWSSDTLSKIHLVTILNVVNYLPEVSLPVLVLLTNKEMKRRFHLMFGYRSNTVSISTLPLAPISH